MREDGQNEPEMKDTVIGMTDIGRTMTVNDQI